MTIACLHERLIDKKKDAGRKEADTMPEVDPKDENILRFSVRPKKAAEILDVSVSTIYRMVEHGSLEGFRLNKRNIRIYEDSICTFQENNRIIAKTQIQEQVTSTKQQSAWNRPSFIEALRTLRSKGCLPSDTERELDAWERRAAIRKTKR